MDCSASVLPRIVLAIGIFFHNSSNSNGNTNSNNNANANLDHNANLSKSDKSSIAGAGRAKPPPPPLNDAISNAYGVLLLLHYYCAQSPAMYLYRRNRLA